MTETAARLLVFDRDLLEARRYWVERLGVGPGPDAVPLDHPRARPTGERGAASFIVDGRVHERLARLTGGRPFLVHAALVAALQACLAKYVPRPTVVVGSPTRPEDGTPNVVAVQVTVEPGLSFRDLLVRTSEALREAYARSRYPHDRLVRDLGLDGVTDRCPLFDVLVRLPGLHAEPPALDPPPDLEIVCADDGHALTGRIAFHPELHERATIEALARHLGTLLAAGLEDTRQAVRDLPLLSPAERHRQLVAWNATAAPFTDDRGAHALFEARAAATPDRVALAWASADGVGELTYAALEARANQIAHALQARGVGPDVLVGVALPRSPDAVAVILGVMKAGGAYVPLDPEYPPERLAFMVEDSGMSLLVSRGPIPAGVARDAAALLDLDAEAAAIAAAPRWAPPCPPLPQHLAYVIYTSGSTGRPKGVAVAHRGLCNMVEAQVRAFEVEPASRVIQLASLSFDASISEILMALAVGAALVLPPERGALAGEDLLRFVRDHGVTHATIPPSSLAVVEGAEAGDLPVLVVAGEACPPALVARWSEGRRMFNAYGPTEITVCATIAACHRDRRPLSIGGPIANTRAHVLDAHGAPAPAGVTGELYLAGVGVARGYLGRPALTAERFGPDPFGPEPGGRLYRTGDLARALEDGALGFVGRADEQVKVRGYRIELGEVEAALAAHPDVQQAVVVAREDVPGDPRLVAYVVPRPGAAAPGRRALLDLARRTLPEHMLPGAVVALPALPRSPAGKIDRRALPAPAPARGGGDGRGPRTATEEIVAGLWARLLDADGVGVDDDFFALGGHSLLATQLVSQLRRTLGVEALAVRDVFEHPTVAALARLLDEARRDGVGEREPPITAAPRTGDLPLSFAQQRLWVLDQLEGRTTAYSLPVGLRLEGALDGEALARALGELVRRHETLRTTFPVREGVPVQHVAPPGAFDLPVVDLAGLDPDPRGLALERQVADLAAEPFDLATGPLLRAALFRLAPRAHVLVLVLHHIVTDGWSMGILVTELSALYQAFISGRRPVLPEPALQYADYAVWQRAWLTPARVEAQLAHWQRHLEGAPALSELPGDRPRPATQTFRGSTLVFAIPADLTRALRALCRSAETTLFMTLLAAFQTVVHRYTGQDDLVVGTDVANRTRAETEGLVGFFVNQLALRTDLSGDPPFRELLRRVRQVCLDAYAHQDLPFQRVLDSLSLDRDLSRTPLFQIKLVLQNAPFGTLDLPGLTISELVVPGDTTTFDLVVALTEQGEGLAGFVTYRTELYDEATIARWLEHWKVVLAAAAEAPDRRLSALPLLTEAERHDLLVAWNATPAAAGDEPPVPRLVEARARAAPDAVALVGPDGTLTYGELDARAGAIARYLRSLGVGAEVPVAVFLPRSLDMVVALLGVLKAGGAYLPLDPSYPLDRLAYMLEDAGPPVVITETALEDDLPAIPIHILLVDAPAWEVAPGGGPDAAGHEGWARAEPVHPEMLAYVIYTSGSTGRPKGVAVPHRGLTSLVRWHRRAYGIDAGDRATQLAGTSFDASVWELWPYLATGATVVLAPDDVLLDPEALRDWLQAEAVTVTFLPTPLAETVLPLPWPASTSVRLLLTGGARLHAWPPPGLPFRVVNNYGPTENTVVTTWTVLDAGAGREGAPPIGRPVDGTRGYVVDAHGAPLPLGVPGELVIGGASLARGYLRQPALTAGAFGPDPLGPEAGARLYATGDLCRHRPDGELQFLGRVDAQVSLRGFRIEPGEIESVLAAHPAVVQAAVVPWERAPGDEALAAYVATPEGEAPPDPGELRAFLRSRLPAYMIPAALVVLPALPLTPNGKVDARRLPPPDAVPSPMAPVAPATPDEALLAEIWADVLRRPRVGIHENFFDLGGDSILAIQIVARAAARGLRIAPRQMFEHQTVADLAAAAERAAAPAAEQGPISGPVPLTPIQRWFLAQPWRAPHHYTQSMLVTTPVGARAADLARAVDHVVAHHDALRLRFTRGGGGWQQVNAPPEAASSLTVVDLSAVPEAERAARLEARAAAAQASLDLAAGPIARFVWFDHGAEKPGRLLLVVHHLAVDTVSWRILLEDLATAHAQIAAGEPVRLPPKTTAFRDWARGLATIDATALADALAFWRETRPAEVIDGADHGTVGEARIVSVALSVEETDALLHDVLRASGAQINDVLLTAVLEAVAGWTARPALLVDLEGHGRDADLVPGADLSRTVGWFTAVAPVCLVRDPEASLPETLRSVRRQLARLQAWTAHHGLLRTLHPDPGVREEMEAWPQPQVSFNYLGQLDAAFPDDGPWRPAPESAGPTQDPGERRTHALEIGGLVLGGRLSVDFRHGPRHPRAEIERLAGAFLDALRALIAHHAGDGIVDVYPLSPLQQGMLFHVLLEPGSHLYFEQVDLLLEGPLDPEAFAGAWRTIVARHDAWRTSFAWRGLAAPCQRVHARAELPWDTYDWRGLSPEAQEDRRCRFLAADRARGLDLERPPLMRGALLRVADDRWHFVWTHHHLVMDGWCLGVLLREAFTLHEAARRGTRAELPPARAYRAFIDWLAARDGAAAERFWRRYLHGFAAPTPIRVTRASTPAPGAAREYPRAERVLSPAVTAALRALCREHRLTLSTVVQGAWALLLGRLSGESDVVFGVTSAGRPADLPGVETMVGLFLNTVPARVGLDPGRALVSWLQDLLADQIAREPFAHCSLVDIHGWSDVPRGQPLFESFVVFENYPVDEALGPPGGLRLAGITATEQVGYPLTLVAGAGDTLSLGLVYDAARFDSPTVERMLDHLALLLGAFATDPGARLGSLPALTGGERRQLRAWNDTARHYPRDRTIPELVAGWAARTPDVVALEFEREEGTETLTYGQVAARAHRLAHHLQGRGVGREVPVAVLLDRSPALVVTFLAILEAGGAFVPLEPEHPRSRLAFMLEDSGAPLVVTERRHAPRVASTTAALVCLEDVDLETERPGAPAGPAGPDSLAYVMYTSGSTGVPKGAAITHRNVVRLATAADYARFTREETFLLLAPVSFDASTLEIWGALLNGGRLVVAPPAMPSLAELGELIARHQVTVMWLTAGLFTRMVEHEAPALRRLRWLLAGGDVLSPRHVRELLSGADALTLVNGYGPTENTVFTCCHPLRSAEGLGADVPIGRPIPATQVHVLDGGLVPAPLGVEGELCAGGDGVGRGYHRRPGLTAERFVPDGESGRPGTRLYRTGDAARWGPDGYLRFLGRLDWQVKIRGFRVEPGEVQGALARHPAVRQAVVVARDGGPAGRQLVAYVTAPDVPDAGALAAELRRALGAELPEHMVPAAFVRLGALPLTPSGKVDRRALPPPPGSVESPGPGPVPPRDAVELQLLDLW